VFDWYWLALEQAPRGPLQLIGLHEEEQKTFVVSPGQWDDDPWPWMPKETLAAFREKRQEYSKIERLGEIELWWEEKAKHEQQWYLRSWLLARLGKMRAAHGAWDEAYAAYRLAMAEVQEPFAESVLWWELGQLRQKHNELDLAREAYLRTQAIRQSAWPQETLALAEAVNDLGILEWERGDLAQAEDLFQRSAQIRQRLAPNSLWLAQTLNDLGLVASNRGQLDKAADAFRHGLKILQELVPDSLALANNLNNLGMIAANRGELDQATEFLQRALVLKQVLAPESLDLAQGLHNLAALAGMRGDLSQATDFFRRALAIRQKLAPASLNVANTLTNLGSVSMARGDLDLAMDYEQRALDLQQKLAPASLQVALSLHNMGILAELRGEQERAKDLHERALNLRQQLAPASLDVANSLNSLAVLAEKRGALKEAMQLHQKALEIRRKSAPDSLDVASSLNNLGVTSMQAGQLEQAESFFHRALDIELSRAPGGLGAATSLISLGDLANRRGDWAQAVSFYQRAMDLQSVMAPGTADFANTLHNLGVTHRLLSPRSLTLVDDLFRRALDTLELQLTRFGASQDSRASFRTSYDRFYRDAIEVQLKLGQPAVAFQTLERSRARSFLDQLAERDTIFTADIPEDLDRERRRVAFRADRTQQQLSGLNHRDHEKQIEELRDQLRRLRDEANDLEEKIRRASPKLAALQYPRPLDLESTRAVLDSGTLVLSYSVGEKDILLFSLSREHDLRVDTLALGETELRELIRNLLLGIGLKGRAGLPRNRSFEAQARKLYALLIEPVSDRVNMAERLLILPDGPLHLLPWGSLIQEMPLSSENPGRSWRYLAEWKPISTALSATVFAEWKKYRIQRDEHASPQSFAAFGDPQFPLIADQTVSTGSQDIRVRSAAQRGFSFEPLPASRREVQRIALLFPQATLYLGPDATEEHAKSLPRKTRIVHFAAHAILDDRFPLNSAVVLSIPEKFEEGHDNGLLQAWEIFEQVRLDADLVVLSACESGLGKEMGGEGLIGLTRAFQYAGARSVMASLWKISDRTTAELMVRFYKHLKDGMAKDEALRAAQRELIQGPIRVRNEKGGEEEIDASAPYYWAAFQIYGDWQ
jgi:CHAT domain-containing protein/Tfp pilus assembly protein PilF